jgi:hypothetical protein
MQLTYQQWTENDYFQMLLIQPDSLQNSFRSVEILYGILQHNLPSCVVLRKDPYILVLSNQILEGKQSLMDFLDALHKSNRIRASFSLGAQGTAEIPWMLNQCLFGLKDAQINTPTDGSPDSAAMPSITFCSLRTKMSGCTPATR